MTKYQPGQDVVIEFDGIKHRGVIINHRGGYCMATMEVDALADYGGVSAMLDPQQTVCVPERHVAVPDTDPTDG